MLFGMLSTENKETFVFCYKITSIIFLYIPVTLYIVMLIVRLSKKIMVPILLPIYSLYVYFIYQNTQLNLLYKDFEWINGYWYFIRTDYGFPTVLYYIVYSLELVIAVILLINWHRKTKFLREKRQSLVLLLFLALLYIFIFTDYVIFHYTNNDLGIVVHYAFIWPVGIGLAIIKYRFLSFPPALFSNDVFENIEESVFILDYDKKVVFANSNARKMISDDIADADLSRVFSDYDAITAGIDRLFKGPESSFTADIVCSKGVNSKLVLHARFSIIKDRYEDRIGVLMIGHELKGAREFTAEYRITERELDVIRFLTTGLSNREIAARLNIAERTVKSHLVNIYEKLDVKNKVGLINVLKRYGLA